MSDLGATKKQLVSPYLIASGVTFFVVAGILIHNGFSAIITISSIGFVESLIGSISYYIGLISVIVLIVMIAITFQKRSSDIIVSIIFLVLLLGFEAFMRFYPGASSVGGWWGNLAILLVYGIIRGIALTFTNKTLKAPRPGYGSTALLIYGWSFLVVSVGSILLTLIGSLFNNYLIILIALILIFIQYFLDAICLIIISFSFVAKAIKYPHIKKQLFEPRPSLVVKPAVSTATYPTSTTYAMDSYQEKDDLTETIKIPQNDDSSHNFCGNCGAVLVDNSEYCSSCGKARS